MSDDRTRRSAYSWRQDPAVPAFDDSRPLVVFDGVCVFCASSMRFIATHDTGRLQFTTAQSALGEALMRHFDLPTGDFETMLLLDEGRVFIKRLGVVAIGSHLRRPWRYALMIWRLLPGRLGDRAYDFLARHRYRLFGRHDHCIVPDARWRARVIS